MRVRSLVAAVVPVAASATALAAGPIAVPIVKGSETLHFQTLATGLTSPTAMTYAPDGSGRLFVVDQAGKVNILQNGALQPTPFLDMSSTIVPLMSGYDERGLLGMAFSPDFNNVGTPGFHKVYTYSSEPVNGTADFTVPNSAAFDNQSVVSEWTVDPSNPNSVLPGSRKVLLKIDHPEFNHDGGTLAFGPDKMLYISEGDGGNANDVGNGHNPTTGNASNTSTVLGKILRIDPTGNNSANGKYGIPASNPFASGVGGQKEIYAYGFRNPFRFSFAPDGGLIAGDVGQNNVEEVDRVVNGGNYGWNSKEGTFLFNPANGSVGAETVSGPGGLIDPIMEYDHDEGIAIVGGFAYHGSLLPELDGKYVFGDFSTTFGSPHARLFYGDLLTGQINEFKYGEADLPLGIFLKGLGEGPDGELYVLASTTLGPTGTTGSVIAIIPEPASMSVAAASISLLLRRRR